MHTSHASRCGPGGADGLVEHADQAVLGLVGARVDDAAFEVAAQGLGDGGGVQDDGLPWNGYFYPRGMISWAFLNAGY